MDKKIIFKSLNKSQVKWRVAGSLILFLVCLVVIFPAYANIGIDWVNNKTSIGIPTLPNSGFNLGLDLQGGAHLVYQAKVDDIPENERASSVEGVRDVIERRVRGGLGVAEPLVQTTKVGEEYRVIVELPGIKNVSDAIQMIGETPVLEFKEANNDKPRDLTDAEKAQIAEYNDNANYKIKNILDEMKAGASLEQMIEKYSEEKELVMGNIGFITEEVHPEIYAWANSANDGDVSQIVIKEMDGMSVVRKLSTRDGEKEVSAKHILICYRGASYCESQFSEEEALSKINNLKAEVTVENFSELAKQNSTEPGASESGGDLGFFKAGQMVPEFENAVWNVPVNTISEVVKTDFGYHLILKTGEQTRKEYEISRVFISTMQASDVLPPEDAWKQTGLSGKQLKRAEVAQNTQTGQIQVSLNFDDAGTTLFSDITSRNVDKQVAIFLDGEILSAPVVNEAIIDGSAVISGNFTWQEAKLLVQRLNSGALPVGIEIINQQTVDASLGMDSLTTSFKAGLIGLMLVALLMIIFYRLSGLISVVSLVIYSVVVLAIFKFIGVTLTLSGIAGFILSIGMAVDANVLVFERLKEELTEGKSLRSATEEAFVRAWPSIRDGNITTLISCVFLIWFGSGFVQGFAVALSLGVLVSMFTTIIITRNFMRFIFSFLDGKKFNWLFLGGVKKEKIS
jgi:protein-export membrane protein SecD